MHLAGCTLASLHPEPLSSFTTRTISVEEESDDDEPKQPKEPLPEQEQKGADFAKYAEAYYLTLNVSEWALSSGDRRADRKFNRTFNSRSERLYVISGWLVPRLRHCSTPPLARWAIPVARRFEAVASR